jgi:hypothetical protein
MIPRLALAESPASSVDPEFEKFLAENHYGPVLTAANYENHQIVDAKINGKDVHLLLDSGAAFTIITRNCAKDLGLNVQPTKMTFLGVGGSSRGAYGIAPLSSFTINNWALNRLSQIFVFPRDGDLTEADGLFGFDYLHLNSAVIIVGGSGFLIRPGLLTQAPPLGKFMRKKGFTPVPLIQSKNRLLIAGTLNGHPIKAQVDTGANYSLFSLDYLRHIDAANVTAYGYIHGVDGRKIDVFKFVPDGMTLGGVQVPRQPLLTGSSPALGVGDDVQALLGFDFLSARRAVLDAGADILWIK